VDAQLVAPLRFAPRVALAFGVGAEPSAGLDGVGAARVAGRFGVGMPVAARLGFRAALRTAGPRATLAPCRINGPPGRTTLAAAGLAAWGRTCPRRAPAGRLALAAASRGFATAIAADSGRLGVASRAGFTAKPSARPAA
jgi:hypothetical protein